MVENLINILIIAGLIVVVLIVLGLILARLYKRSTKEISFVRTGFRGQKVIMNGGALVFPVLHEVIPVNMNTLRLEVKRANDQALITRDRMRVDVTAEFYVRVKPTEDSIANAAQTLGMKTINPDELKQLVEGKFVDALRAVAAEMAMEELHEQRVDFVQKVQQAVSEDLLKNGLELESVSLTGLDQTSKEFFNPDNVFDAEGLTRLTEEIEERRKKRNDIEQDTEVAIENKNLEAESKKLEINRDKEYATLKQQREIEIRRAAQSAEIKREQAEKKREAEQAEIEATQQVDMSKISAERVVEEERIEKDRQLREKDISKARAIETAEIERRKTVELAEQDRAIAIAEKSKAQSESQAEADRARAVAVKEKIKVAAEAEKNAAQDQAEAVRTLANADADQQRIKAEGEAEAEKLRADAAEKRYAVDAQGKRALNESHNILSTEQIAMQIRMALIKYLPDIIRESVKPMEKIDGIKIIQVDGLRGGNSRAAEGSDAATGSLADQVVNGALRYRSQAPLIDSLLADIGLSAGDINGLTEVIRPRQDAASKVTAPKPATGSDAAEKKP